VKNMTSLQEKINNDWKEAMKMRDPRKDTLGLMKNELKNRAISDRSDKHSTLIDDEAAVEVFKKMAKQRQESIRSFQAGKREDLVEKEAAELTIIESYLPKQLTDDEIKTLVESVASELHVTSIKELGKVMGVAMARVKGKADGNRVQFAVKQFLESI
jgi:uncharacterized protein